MVGLLAVAVLAGEVVVGPTGGDDPRHRLTHAAADVADQAAVLHLRAADAKAGGDRVAEGQVAEVADVERLGGVRAPEVDGVTLTRGEVGVGPRTGGTGLEMVRQALERGHSVTAFVRSPDRLKILPTAPDIKSKLINFDTVWWMNNVDDIVKRWSAFIVG